MLTVIMLNVVMLSVIMLIVVAPSQAQKTNLKSPGANVIKHFCPQFKYSRTKLECVYEIGWKSLPRTNTLAYYESS